MRDIQKELALPLNGGLKISILLSTGEVSGDLIGANLAKGLRAVHSKVALSGVGGARMEKAGVQLLFNSNRLGSVGISEPLVTIPAVVRSFKNIRAHVLKEKPDVAVLIGHDVFHLLLSRWLRFKKVFTMSYFPPQVWLWRGIAGIIARSYDQILTSFAQEDSVYRRAGANTVFVGHYLLDQIKEISPKHRDTVRQSLGLSADHPLVALLPGSRGHELNYLVPVLLDVVGRMVSEEPSLQFILPMADSCFERKIEDQVRRAGLDRWIHLNRDSREAMAASDMAILCSGTVTLEAALMGLPMIILYKVSRVSWMAVKLLDATGLIESKTVGLPNLLMGKKIVPELIQSQVLGSRVAARAWAILRDPARQASMRNQMQAVPIQLGETGGPERAARVILRKAMEAAQIKRPKARNLCLLSGSS